jgi:hypothetical protein
MTQKAIRLVRNRPVDRISGLNLVGLTSITTVPTMAYTSGFSPSLTAQYTRQEGQ